MGIHRALTFWAPLSVSPSDTLCTFYGCVSTMGSHPDGTTLNWSSHSRFNRIHKPHVKLVTDPIKEITSEGVLTITDEMLKVDRIIFATGFDTSFKPKYPLLGRSSLDLGDVWSKRPKGEIWLSHYVIVGKLIYMTRNSLYVTSCQQIPKSLHHVWPWYRLCQWFSPCRNWGKRKIHCGLHVSCVFRFLCTNTFLCSQIWYLRPCPAHDLIAPKCRVRTF